MARLPPLLLVALALAGCDCGGYPESAGPGAGLPAGGAAGAGGVAGDGAGGEGGTGGTGGSVIPSELAGLHFAASMIGDCIDVEEWLSFAADGTLTHTWADRNFCGDWGVRLGAGHWAVTAPGLVELAWIEPDGTEEERAFTYALVDEPGLAELNSWPDGYVAGPLLLELGALLRDADGTFRNLVRRSTVAVAAPGSYSHEEESLVELTVDPELGGAEGPCTFGVSLRASVVSSYPGGGDGSESVTGACTLAPIEGSPRHRLAGAGFEAGPWNGSWPSFSGHPPLVASVLDSAFRPYLLFDPADPASLFQPAYGLRYSQLLTPPPRTVEELGPRP